MRPMAWLWILGMLVVATGGAVAAGTADNGGSLAAEPVRSAPPSLPPSVTGGGGQPNRLDELLTNCLAGDMADCDSLYLESPVGSHHEGVGASCGDRVTNPTPGRCTTMWTNDPGGSFAAPTQSSAPVPTAATQAPENTPSGGDLGIPGVQVSSPACDGQFVLFVGSAVTPGQYAEDVAAFLDLNPGSTYVDNARACTSLRAFTEEGNRIYGVYYGPFSTEADALDSCHLAAAEDAFVKPLDNVTDPGEYILCSEA